MGTLPDRSAAAAAPRRPGAIERVNSFLRTLAALAVVALLGWWTLFFRGLLADSEQAIAERDERIDGLQAELVERDARIQELELAKALLQVDHRVARLQVLEQSGEAGDLRTRVRFSELEPDGRPLDAGREFELAGSLVYVDALVIKFDDHYVERGDFLRGTSICLFRRLFGEHQKPSDGFPIDAEGARPRAYRRGEAPEALHTDLWRRFWDYANDPELAASAGVRAAHGEAPFVELRPGASYLLELRASGGLSIQPE